MIDIINNLKQEIIEKLKTLNNSEAIENFRMEYLVKKGKIQQLFDKMKELPKEEKPIIGKELNLLRKFVEDEFKELKIK